MSFFSLSATASFDSNTDDFINLINFENKKISLYMLHGVGTYSLTEKQKEITDNSYYDCIILSSSDNKGNYLSIYLIVCDTLLAMAKGLFPFPISFTFNFSCIAILKRKLFILLPFFFTANSKVSIGSIYLNLNPKDFYGYIGFYIMNLGHSASIGGLYDYDTENAGIYALYCYNPDPYNYTISLTAKYLSNNRFSTFFCVIFGEISSVWGEIWNDERQKICKKITAILNVLYLLGIPEDYQINFMIALSTVDSLVSIMLYFIAFYLQIGWSASKGIFISIGLNFYEDLYKIYNNMNDRTKSIEKLCASQI